MTAINFLHNGKLDGLWIEPKDLPPERWQKLKANLLKKVIPQSRSHVYIVSATAWSSTVAGKFHAEGARRILTGKPLSVSEKTVDACLAAIEQDEQLRLSMPREPERQHWKDLPHRQIPNPPKPVDEYAIA